MAVSCGHLARVVGLADDGHALLDHDFVLCGALAVATCCFFLFSCFSFSARIRSCCFPRAFAVATCFFLFSCFSSSARIRSHLLFFVFRAHSQPPVVSCFSFSAPPVVFCFSYYHHKNNFLKDFCPIMLSMVRPSTSRPCSTCR